MAAGTNIVANIFRIPELRRRVLFTLLMILIVRVGSYIPVPGINPVALERLFTQTTSGLLGFLDLFAGGALSRFTVFALGIMPYISASIILQLLTVVIPALERLSKEGEVGRKKIQQISRFATVVIAAIQAYALTVFMKSRPEVIVNPGLGFTINAIIAITAGTLFLMWIGEQITERGIGNGISLIIFVGIVARIPVAFKQVYDQLKIGELNPIILIVSFGIFIGIIAFVILEQQGQRRIPIQHAKKVIGRKVYSAQATYLPFKINPSGVIPIIFASSLLLFPAQIAQTLGARVPALERLAVLLSPGNALYLVLYALLIIFFTYFYTQIQMNPIDIADNLKKVGGYIPGIRPGVNTSTYLQRVLNRIVLPGSIFLAIIALIPTIIQRWLGLPPAMAYLMGGTSLLIMVGVDLDTMKQIESHLLMRHYDGFMRKGGKLRGRNL
ncbi:MAG: preprotein translocase subunit SecY [Spirochaetes bacterium DG_61]|jgi:preprotein translocase subunit SecY|nr:MAG: preprotein translocase subunit SecY [Spirochaetes bacterium DG_61]